VSTSIGSIVDYTAWRAATSVTGLAAVYAAGASGLLDPLRPTQLIRPAAENPAQELEHWSEVAQLTTNDWTTQDAQEKTWLIPMRLWLGRADLARMRKIAQPFFALYDDAFASDPTLGGWALVSHIVRMELGEDPPATPGQTRWGWLEIHLEVTELVTYVL
jgi:hypothetical protein